MKTVTVRIGARGRPGAAGASSWTDITGKPSTFPPSSHTHAIADTTGLQAALDAKAAASHTHAQSDVTGLTSALAAKADLVDGMVPTNQISAIAITEFLGSVANEADMLALSGQRGDWCNRSDVSKAFVLVAEPASTLANWAAIDYPASPVLSVNGQAGTVVLGKSDVGLGNVPNTDATSRANHTGTQAISTVVGLQDALDGKAASSHTHAQSDVTGLEAALAGKAASSHTHAQSDVTGLEAALAGKAASSHTHALSAITQSGATNNQVPAWNGSAWVPTTPTSGSAITTPKVLHVTTAGNDTTGDGSLGAPYLTGTKAFTVALALTGQNICIQFGVGSFSCTCTDIWPSRITVRGCGAAVSALDIATDDHVRLWSDKTIMVSVTAMKAAEGQNGPDITLYHVRGDTVATLGTTGTTGSTGTPGDGEIQGGSGGDGGTGGNGGAIALIDCHIDIVESAAGAGGAGGDGGYDGGAGQGSPGAQGPSGTSGGVRILRSHVGSLACGAYDMGCSNIATVNEGSLGNDYGANSNMPVPSL